MHMNIYKSTKEEIIKMHKEKKARKDRGRLMV